MMDWRIRRREREGVRGRGRSKRKGKGKGKIERNRDDKLDSRERTSGRMGAISGTNGGPRFHKEANSGALNFRFYQSVLPTVILCERFVVVVVVVVVVITLVVIFIVPQSM